jgi:hypothetical protein
MAGKIGKWMGYAFAWILFVGNAVEHATTKMSIPLSETKIGIKINGVWIYI